VPPNPVELLASRRLGLLVKELEKHFDRVIIDGPPMQGFADTLVLSRSVGGVVLVSSVGETTREALRHFRKNILNVNSTILGCIINKVDLTRRYGYNSYYKYYGHYRYNNQDENKKQEPARQLPA
jgi:polysaccharide biosynthesis transport protein